MVDKETELTFQIKVVCETCGANLKADQWYDELRVEPCEGCLEDARDTVRSELESS